VREKSDVIARMIVVDVITLELEALSEK